LLGLPEAFFNFREKNKPFDHELKRSVFWKFSDGFDKRTNRRAA